MLKKGGSFEPNKPPPLGSATGIYIMYFLYYCSDLNTHHEQPQQPRSVQRLQQPPRSLSRPCGMQQPSPIQGHFPTQLTQQSCYPSTSARLQQPRHLSTSARSQQPPSFIATGHSHLRSHLSASRHTQQSSHLPYSSNQRQPSQQLPTTASQSVISHNVPSSSVTMQHQPTLSSLFNWNPSSTVGKKRKKTSKSQGSNKKKIPTWTHTFVCLARVDQEIIPDGQERAELQIAGLGEKRVPLSSYADAQEYMKS